MTQKEKEQTCVKICAYICKKLYKKTYPNESKKRKIIDKINSLIGDIEDRLNIVYNGDRNSIVEVTNFILENINALQQDIERDRFLLYESDIVDVTDTY